MYITKGVDPLLCSRLFFISTRSAKCGVESAFRKRIQQRFCFQQAATFLRAQHKWIGACVERFLVLVDKKLRANLLRVLVAEFDHLGKLVACIHVEERERNPSGEERFLRQAQHYRGVFSDGIKHHRMRKLGRGFPKDVDALCFEGLEVAEPRANPRLNRRFLPVAGFYCAEQLLRRRCHWSFPLDGNARIKTKNPPANSPLAVGSITARLELEL